jgi:hypothetical protein
MGWIADAPLQHAADAGTDVRMAVPALVENGDRRTRAPLPFGCAAAADKLQIKRQLKDHQPIFLDAFDI